MSTTTRLSELTGEYVLDPARTRIGFVARHTMATRVRGHFEAFEGGAYLDGEHPSGSSATLTIQASSLQSGNPQRDGMLRGQFVGMDDHPALTFTLTGVEQAGETVFKATGDLFIRGVARQVTLDVELTGAETDSHGDLLVTLGAGATVNRHDWGVNWNAATTVLISPKVTLDLDLALIRR